jgi:hypothetical protein
VTGLGPIIAYACYAALLWGVALGLDAIGRRSLRARPGPPGPRPVRPSEGETVAITSDVARFHSVIAGAVLGAAAFVVLAYVLARRDLPALLLVPIAGACAAGAFRRLVPLWREP